MEQTVSQSNKQSKSNPRRTLWFLAFLLVLVAFVATGGSRFILQNARTSLVNAIEQNMTSQAHSKVAILTVWFGTLTEQTSQLANMDMVRLFAFEAGANDYDAAELLRLSHKSVGDSGLIFSHETDSRVGLAQLGAQAPLMRRQLASFIEKNSMVSGGLYNTLRQPYISTVPESESRPLSPERDAAMQLVMLDSKAHLTPIRQNEHGQLVMDLILPLFAPMYIESSGTKCIGTLMVVLDVTSKVHELTSIANRDSVSETGRILQFNGDILQEVPADGSAPLDLPGWQLNAQGNLSLEVRALPGTGNLDDMRVYSMALAVPDTPLLVGQDLPEIVATARYNNFQRSVILSASLITLLAGLILLMLWWSLLGRRERAMAEEVRQLYETVNQQKQIIDGVNTTLADGIVLSDLEGRIPYANQAFAYMAEESVESITTKTYRTLIGTEMAHNIMVHTDAVRRANSHLTFTNVLTVKGRTRNYQVVCSPFRDEQGTLTGVVSVYRDITRMVAAQERAQHMINQTIHVFVRAIEAVDPYLRGQSAQTGVLAVALADKMKLPQHEATLRTAANLSQIGMIQLPHSLITKTGKLSPDERAQLEKHVEFAQAVLQGIDFGLPILDAITQMHERLDGSGYPLQLKGDAIGIDGRILGVTSTFCAILRPRSYREARSLDEAMQILSAEPIKYDPAVVLALRDFLDTPEGQKFYGELTRVA